MKSLIKGIGLLVSLAVTFLMIVGLFGVAEPEPFTCQGEVIRNGEPRYDPATLYARFEAYRWFIFWADHDGVVNWEIQPGGYRGSGYYSEDSLTRVIKDFDGKEINGAWSSLSQQVWVDSPLMHFKGSCQV